MNEKKKTFEDRTVKIRPFQSSVSLKPFINIEACFLVETFTACRRREPISGLTSAARRPTTELQPAAVLDGSGRAIFYHYLHLRGVH